MDYGAAFADIYDEWYGPDGSESDAASALAALVDEAGGGAVVELGVGTGRLAAPMAATGARVVGVDLSLEMLGRLRAAHDVPGAAIATVAADMAALPIRSSSAAVVVVARDTLCNAAAPGQMEQVVAEAARVTRPGGFVVIELSVPHPERPTRGWDVVRDDVHGLTLVEWDHHSPDVVVGRHLTVGIDGARVRPWAVRLVTPDQLDVMAAAAGLVPERRWGGWDRRAAGADDGCLVHVHRRT